MQCWRPTVLPRLRAWSIAGDPQALSALNSAEKNGAKLRVEFVDLLLFVDGFLEFTDVYRFLGLWISFEVRKIGEFKDNRPGRAARIRILVGENVHFNSKNEEPPIRTNVLFRFKQKGRTEVQNGSETCDFFPQQRWGTTEENVGCGMNKPTPSFRCQAAIQGMLATTISPFEWRNERKCCDPTWQYRGFLK